MLEKLNSKLLVSKFMLVLLLVFHVVTTLSSTRKSCKRKRPVLSNALMLMLAPVEEQSRKG